MCVCVLLGEEANRKGTAVGRSIGMASRLIANTPFPSRWPGGRIECMLQYRSRNNLLQKWVSTPTKTLRSRSVPSIHPPTHSFASNPTATTSFTTSLGKEIDDDDDGTRARRQKGREDKSRPPSYPSPPNSSRAAHQDTPLVPFYFFIFFSPALFNLRVFPSQLFFFSSSSFLFSSF